MKFTRHTEAGDKHTYTCGRYEVRKAFRQGRRVGCVAVADGYAVYVDGEYQCRRDRLVEAKRWCERHNASYGSSLTQECVDAGTDWPERG